MCTNPRHNQEQTTSLERLAMKPFQLALSLSAALLATAALAAGNHAGGHAHADDAIGKAGNAAKVSRTVNVDMTDAMRFTPSSITVKQGETIRLIVKNSGKLKHELVLGTEKDLKEHYEQMKKHPEMEHDDPNMVSLAPGKTGEVIWQFTKAGKVDFACLQPGHYEAGMKGSVMVAGTGTATAAEAKKDSTSVAVAMAATDLAQGEIRKVDADNKKITIKHGEIKNLDMPPMTMVFQVKDEGMLSKVKAGDKVRFKAEKSGGAFVVTDLQPAQ
jgi:uncharacterized cupredoxin-like copper-binding protein/Cu/Ag efflux protein CusF